MKLFCCKCAEEIKGNVVILHKMDYMRLKTFGSSGCACETTEGQIAELCCAHDEFYQEKLSKLREAFKTLMLNTNLAEWNTDTCNATINLLRAVREVLEDEHGSI